MEDIELFIGPEGEIHVSSQLQQLNNSFDRYSALSTPSYQTATFKRVSRIICADHTRTLVFDSFAFISKGDIEICWFVDSIGENDCSHQQQKMTFMIIHEVEMPSGMLLKGMSARFPEILFLFMIFEWSLLVVRMNFMIPLVLAQEIWDHLWHNIHPFMVFSQNISKIGRCWSSILLHERNDISQGQQEEWTLSTNRV